MSDSSINTQISVDSVSKEVHIYSEAKYMINLIEDLYSLHPEYFKQAVLGRFSQHQSKYWKKENYVDVLFKGEYYNSLFRSLSMIFRPQPRIELKSARRLNQI